MNPLLGRLRRLSRYVGLATILALAATGSSVGLAAADDEGDPSLNAPAPPAANVGAGPTLSCSIRALPIMALEVTGARLVCQVSSAPASDRMFTIQVTRVGADAAEVTQPPSQQVCSGALEASTGICTGALIDRSGATMGELTITGTLLPSGTRLGPVAGGSPPASPAAPTPMQFEPLPQL